jgi:hypothetical protein
VSRAAHGGLIALMIAVFCGYVALGAHLGWSSCVRAATVAYGVGVVSHLGAALFSGFVVSGLAERYTGKLASELAALEPVLVACHETNQALAVTGSLAMSAAIALWSAVLFGRGTFARALAVLGACVGLGTAAALLTGNLRLHVHGMALVVTSQAAWAIGVAIWLARERWRAR